MADVRQLQEDVRYWLQKTEALNRELRDANEKLTTRQRELTRAMEDEAREANKKKS